MPQSAKIGINPSSHFTPSGPSFLSDSLHLGVLNIRQDRSRSVYFFLIYQSQNHSIFLQLTPYIIDLEGYKMNLKVLMCLGNTFSCLKLTEKFYVLKIFGLTFRKHLKAQSHNLKVGSHKKMIISFSRKVLNLPFVTPK